MSNVLRLPTDKGDLYLKSPGSLFITELRFTALFREWGIAKLPEWLAWNEELNCALMPDMGGHDLAEALSMESARAALLQFAKIQQTSVLFLSGAQDLLYDRRPSTISAAMDSFCARVRKALDGSLYELSEPDLLSLAGNAARAKALLQQIDGTLPSVLHHGDLRSGNIRMLPSGPMIYDWAWAGVSHPFVDVTAFLHIHRRDLEGQSNDREQLLESYLACWQEYAPIKTLRRWFVITDALKELFMAYDDLLWVERILAACPAETDPFSADGWLLEKRRYYLERVLRRFLEKDFSEVD